MAGRTQSLWQPVLALCVCGVAWTACNKQEARPAPPPPSAPLAPPARLAPADPLSALDAIAAVQPAHSTSDAAIALPWQDVTGTDGKGTTRKFTGPIVLVGREKLWLGDKAVAKLQCLGKNPEDCQPGSLTQPNAQARFAFAAGDVVDGKLPGLAAATQSWQGQTVPVVADRRVTWGALETVLATLRASGVKPVIAVAGNGGTLVDALGVGTGLPEAATLADARRAANPGSSEAGGLPADATTLTVLVGIGGISVEIGRAQGEPARPDLLGNIVESLIALADRLHLAAPQLTKASVHVEPEVVIEQVVRVIDGLRDTCGRTAHAQACTARTVLFAEIAIALDHAGDATATTGDAGKPDAPPTAGADRGGLHLDAPAGGGLHLSDKPAANANGLHL